MKRAGLSLIDVNGVYGKFARGGAGFNTLGEKLASMDRLGVDRALVWNIDAQQNHPLASNQKMFNDIMEGGPEVSERIIPSLAISGLIHYEHNGVESLREMMRLGNTRSLRYVNALGVSSISQLEPVISQVSDLKPFLVLRHAEAPANDIVEFARMMPELPIVLTEIMWGAYIKVLDIMRRCPNVMIDTSWLHTMRVIEIAVSSFGSERVCFGLGSRSHNGASIAELACADISEEERALIAHGNLNRLMGEQSVKSLVAEQEKDESSFWEKCITGQKLGVELIDAHAHI
ncbi:MAG: amidohydrolase family protein, partial [Lentisphaerae bacterium]|nr:amidohydrolase family protein [Lentisphaerota bacterium]